MKNVEMTDATLSELSQDELFELLSSARRRFILYYLQRERSPVELQTLAEELAAWENKTQVDQLTPQQRKRVYVSLYQTHIPKLEDMNIITYDSETGIIELTDEPNQIMAILGEREKELPWQLIYLFVSGVAILLYIGMVLEFPILAELTAFTLGVLIVASFAIISLIHYYYVRIYRPMTIEIEDLS